MAIVYKNGDLDDMTPSYCVMTPLMYNSIETPMQMQRFCLFKHRQRALKIF